MNGIFFYTFFCVACIEIVQIFSKQTILSSSPWLEKIRSEVKHFEDIRLDVDKLLLQARESDRIRSQMVVLERRVQVNFCCNGAIAKFLYKIFLLFRDTDSTRGKNCSHINGTTSSRTMRRIAT